jgi:hypothetical protein
MLGNETHPLTTIDVSEGGMLFLTDRKLPESALLDIALTLPDSRAEVGIVGRIVHVEEHGIGDYEIAVSFMALSSRDQNLIASYVRESTPLSDAEDPGSKIGL